MASADLIRSIDIICTHLAEGEAWHRRVANELRKLPNRRGFARWHEAESKYDQCEHLDIAKLARDHLQHTPAVDIAYVTRAETYTIADNAGFTQHFDSWVAREDAFLANITTAIEYARTEDMELYARLCCLSKEVKNEAIRADWVRAGLVETGWSPHDVRVVSKWLHDYFECKYDGGSIDFNIG